jgi:hypothetical protein
MGISRCSPCATSWNRSSSSDCIISRSCWFGTSPVALAFNVEASIANPTGATNQPEIIDAVGKRHESEERLVGGNETATGARGQSGGEMHPRDSA